MREKRKGIIQCIQHQKSLIVLREGGGGGVENNTQVPTFLKQRTSHQEYHIAHVKLARRDFTAPVTQDFQLLQFKVKPTPCCQTKFSSGKPILGAPLKSSSDPLIHTIATCICRPHPNFGGNEPAATLNSPLKFSVSPFSVFCSPLIGSRTARAQNLNSNLSQKQSEITHYNKPQ